VDIGPAKRPDIAAAPSTAPRDIYSVLTARTPSPGAINHRILAAEPRRAAVTREQACLERGRGVAALPRCWRGGGQAHRRSGASLPFATTKRLPQHKFDPHQRRETLRPTSPSPQSAHGFAAPVISRSKFFHSTLHSSLFTVHSRASFVLLLFAPRVARPRSPQPVSVLGRLGACTLIIVFLQFSVMQVQFVFGPHRNGDDVPALM
jgi:hypothetical protein